MSRRTLNILGILILMGITAIVSVLAYIYIVGGSGQASQPISAPTLDPNATATPDANALETQVAELSQQVADLQATNAALVTAGGQNADPPTPEAADPTAAQAAAILFRISADESEVRFELDEMLRGQPTHVVGTTNQVAGDILVDFASPPSSRVGEIRINARTLATDQEFRNRAIRSEILESSRDEYEFISFTPTALEGLPETVEAGQEVTFQIVGDLKIRQITQSVTFEVTATATEDRLEGSATTMVTRDQFGLVIPNAPGVADVTNEVVLTINFVALKVEQ
jgi:polyisoprenoid-binding protein YceI